MLRWLVKGWDETDTMLAFVNVVLWVVVGLLAAVPPDLSQ